MLNIYIWPVSITAVFFTGFGLLAYIQNRKESPNRMFGLVALAFGIWSYSWLALLLVKEDMESAIFWARLLNLGATFIPIFFLHWTLSVLNLHKKRKPLLIIGYLITFLFAIFSFSHFFIQGVHTISIFPFWPTPGVLYKWFLLFVYFGMMGYGLFQLLKEFGKQEEKEIKYQIVYIIIGSLLGFGGGAINFLLMYKIEIYQWIGAVGVFGVMFSPFVLGYAAIKHHLMNIKVIATELFAGLMVILTVADIFSVQSLQELIYKIIVSVIVLIFAILLVRSVLQEVKRREQLQLLSIQLEEANKHLKELLKMKSEFLAIASHQLRTPLTAIRGLLSMQAEGSFDSYPRDKMKQVHQDMLTSANRLNNIVNDLLDALEVEGGLQLEFKLVQLEPIINEVITTLKPNYDKKGLYLKFEKPVTPLPKIEGEKRYLHEVIMNLIDNAEKYTRQGGVTINTQVSGTNVIIRVKDTGVGIKPEDQKKLFDKFSRGSDANKVHADGSGLGLFIIKKIVDEHHGRVKIESAGEGQGTTFIVSLPIKQNK